MTDPTTRIWPSSSTSTSSGSLRPWATSATDTNVGRRRRLLIMTCCGCPMGRPNGSRCGRWWDCSRSAPPPSSKSAGKISWIVERCSCSWSPPRTSPANHDPLEDRASPGRRLASISTKPKIRRVLARMLDPDEFLSDYGIRSLSRYHARSPLCLQPRRGGVSGVAISRRSPTPACSAATPTGAARSGCR